jgi:hypothetical protein
MVAYENFEWRARRFVRCEEQFANELVAEKDSLNKVVAVSGEREDV